MHSNLLFFLSLAFENIMKFPFCHPSVHQKEISLTNGTLDKAYYVVSVTAGTTPRNWHIVWPDGTNVIFDTSSGITCSVNGFYPKGTRFYAGYGTHSASVSNAATAVVCEVLWEDIDINKDFIPE